MIKICIYSSSITSCIINSSSITSCIIHSSSITFLSLYLGLSKADLDECFTNELVLDGLNRVFPTTSFFLIYNPKEISISLFSSDPTTFLVSMAPRKAIGFSLFLMSKLNCLHFVLFFSFPTSNILSLEVCSFKNYTDLAQYNSISFMYS